MSTTALRSLGVTATRAAARRSVRAAPSLISRRALNTETAPILYSAHARVVGARTGHVDGDDLKIDLTMAKALGGKGDKGKTNPEELFAAGYGACFQAAMNAVAPSVGVRMPSKPEDSDMGLRVDMTVKVKGLSQSDLEQVVEKAKEMCPYSRATKGNVATNVKIEAFE